MARTILLADDSVTAQNMGRKILTDAGYEVVTVNNGSAALKKITECKPAVVVLDVYMPGYSGLEVCARIKEGRESERIPVLLTVGKLEPFRQEEARKVRADAFIIKPFEATELLAALNKLELKATSHSESRGADQPSGQVQDGAKHVVASMDRYEQQVAETGPRFGDHESGWKARLTMPSPGSKPEELQEKAEIKTSASAPFREFERDAQNADSIASLPSDVTAEELAAIAAAAAAIGSTHRDRDFERLTSEAESPSAGERADICELQVPANQPAAVEVETGGTSLAAGNPTDGADEREAPAEAAAIALVSGSDSASMALGARWVAEEVPLEAAESALVLEREMEKAFATFASPDPSSAPLPGPMDTNQEAVFASAAPAAAAPTSSGGWIETLSEETRASQPSLRSSGRGPGSSSVIEGSPEIAKTPAATSPPVMADEVKGAFPAFREPDPFGSLESTPTEQIGRPEAGLNDHAGETSAASGGDEWHNLRPVAFAPASPSSSSSETFEPVGVSSADFGALQNRDESALDAVPSADTSSSSLLSDDSLSSIVDSMLAELKPKLMAELAKKLERK